MNAVVYHRSSGEFIIERIEIPVPGAAEIRVKVLACALNPVDAKVSQWIPATMETIVLGLDVCGVVDAVGSEVTNLCVGDLVLYHGKMFDGNGGFAEYSIHDAETTVNLSREFITNHDLVVSFAGSPCAAWTAYKGLVDSLSINLSNHADNSTSTIAIIGASGGVGSFLLQFARMANFKNIIAVCSGKHAEYVTSLGATDVIDYLTESLGNGFERVLRKLGTSLDFVIDCVGAETVKAAVDHTAYGGRILPLVSFADFGDIRCFMKSITIAQLALGGGHNGGLKARQRIKAIGEVVTELIVNKQLSVPVTSIVGLEGVGPALEEMVNANNTGKIVLSFLK